MESMTLFDLDGDDIAAGKVGIVEDATEDALGEQVLDEHLLYRFDGKVRIDGLAANIVEGVEALDEGGIAAALLFDLVLDRLGELRDVVLEFGDGFVPLLDVGLAVGEELFEQLDKVLGVANVFVQPLTDAVLKENGALRRLEGDVAARIAALQLGADSLLQVVVIVLGFPIASRQTEGVEQCAVNADGVQLGRLEWVLGHQCQVELPPATCKHALEGAADRHLVVYVELPELPQHIVVALHELVRMLEVKLLHGNGSVYNGSAGIQFTPRAEESPRHRSRRSGARAASHASVTDALAAVPSLLYHWHRGAAVVCLLGLRPVRWLETLFD
jgi:hypothetical protein